MARHVLFRLVLYALPAALAAPTAAAQHAAPGFASRGATALIERGTIDDCITDLTMFEDNVIAVVDNRTVVKMGQFGADTVIGTASGSHAGDYPPICDILSTDGKVVVAGALTGIDGRSFSGIAAWDGESWGSVGAGIDGTVVTLGAFRGRLIAGGEFTEAGGIRARNVARFELDRWMPLGSGLDSVIRSFAVWNNRLIADDGAGLHLWDGRSWGPIDASGECLSGDWQVSALAAFDGYLVAGKSCRECDRVSVCAWDGRSWNTVGELRGSSYPPSESGAWSMTVYNGTLVVGGIFSDPGNNLARWDGDRWTAMGLGTDGAVCALAAYDGRLYTGGRFAFADGKPADDLAAWEDSIKSPQRFSVSIYESGVWLNWVTPPDTAFRSTVVRFATDGCPSDPSQGMPVPNGENGVFRRPPGAWDGFWHGGLTRGVTYYYSAFAWYADSTYSRPATLIATLEDCDPPYGMYAFKATPSDGSVKLDWRSAFDEDFKEVLIRYDTAAFPLSPTDGLPLPNGNQGRFEGAPGAENSFVHSDLANGITYRYSAFAFDSSANYSMPRCASGTPMAMVRDFEAVAESLAVSLTWCTPPDSSIERTFICFRTGGYPKSADDGTPLPNGEGGWFEAPPGEQAGFRHTGLAPGRTYCYGAFACDASTNCSAPAFAQARVPYATPPNLSLWVSYVSVPDRIIDLEVWSTADLDSASLRVSVGGIPISRSQSDPCAWLWDPAATCISDSIPIVASACDIDGNWGRMESRISATSLPAGRPGLSRSAQRRVRVEFDPQAASQNMSVAILPTHPALEYWRSVRLLAADEPTWTYLIVPQDTIARNSAYVIFSYGGTDLDSLGSPAGLIITLEGVGMIRSYTDTLAKTVSAQVSHLGLFTLSMGASYPDRFVDQSVFEVTPASPNPFTEEVSLRYEIRASHRVKIGVYDAAGRRVTGVADAPTRPGMHSVTWDGRNQWGEPAQSGVYFLRIDNGVKSSTSKVVLVR